MRTAARKNLRSSPFLRKLSLPFELATAAVNERARLALGKKASPVRPTYTNANVLRALDAFPRRLIGYESHGSRGIGTRLRSATTSVRTRTILSKRADSAIEPSEVSVERYRAA